MLSAFAPMSIDMYLPALGAIAGDLAAARGDVQLTLSAFMVAFGVGQIVYGPFGDRFGRRPVLFVGVALYIAASLACALATSVDQLIALRFLQGLGACSGPAMARAMVRDLADKDRGAQALSTIMAAVSFAPMLAPFVGANVLEWAGWREIFVVLAGFGAVSALAAWLGARETLRPELRGPLALLPVLRRYGQLVASRNFMGYGLCSGCLFAAMFAFISGSPFVLIGVYGLSPREYSYCFGVNVLVMTVGATLNGRLVRRYGSDLLLRRATILPAVAGAALLALALVEHATGRIGFVPFLPLFALFIASLSLIAPNATAGALQRYPHMAGVASSAIGVVQFGLGALAGAVVGQLPGETILPMAAVMALGGALCLVVHRTMIRPQGA